MFEHKILWAVFVRDDHMAAEKTIGIVLRVIAFSETSCIVTLYTREFGKITTMAKGARRPKSPFEAALDVLAICRIVFIEKSSGAMGLLTEAKLERRFRSASTNLKRLYAGYYIIELLNTLTDEGDPVPELFDSALEAITMIDSDSLDQADSRLAHEILRFELKTLELLGHLPMLTKCVSCGREKTTLSRVSFGLDAGGILCSDCRKGQPSIVSLSAESHQYLLSMVGGQIGANQLNSDNWNGPDRIQTGLFRQPGNVSEAAGTAYIVNSEEANPTAAHPTTTPTATKLLATETPLQAPTEPETDSTSTDKNKCVAESRLLVNKYITHLLGFPLKLNKYLNNL
ncbi:MAG: DNA repair protein RecO (recombination protein O) [Mariniblastus sp.]